MAEMLHGYNYEPEYTDEELELRNSVQAATAELPNFSDWCQYSVRAVVKCQRQESASVAGVLMLLSAV